MSASPLPRVSADMTPAISSPALRKLKAAERTVREGGFLADQLGNLKARTADCKEAEEVVKAQLIEMASVVWGPSIAFEGVNFRVTVTFADKKVTDYRAVIDALVSQYKIPSDLIAGLIAMNTAVAEGVPTVRCTARKAD